MCAQSKMSADNSSVTATVGMRSMFLQEIIKYDGHQLHHRFAYQYFADQCRPTGDIIAFRGPMEVLEDAMIDQEDVINRAFIYSDDAVNFLWEIPLLGNNRFGAVTYQRLFNTQIATLLSSEFLNKPVRMKGDDIMVMNNNRTFGKASVSITHVKNHAALGHTGINIKAGNRAPDIAYSTHLSDEAVNKFAEAVVNLFHDMNRDMFVATSKIRV